MDEVSKGDRIPATEAAPAATPAAQPVPLNGPNLAESTTVKLFKPVTIGGMRKEEMTVRRPKVRDRLIAERMQNISEGERQVMILANCIGVAPNEIEMFDMLDYKQLEEAMLSFIRLP